MKLTNNQPDNLLEAKPPVFQTWKQLYTFVLVLHVFIVIFFYLFKIVFS